MLKLVSIDDTDPYLLTLKEIRDHCYETSEDYDSMLINISRAVREYVEKEDWVQIIPATYILYLDEFPDVIELPKPPVIGVTSIYYYNTSDSKTELSSSLYQADLNSKPGRIRPISGESWPDTYDRLSPIEVTFTAGMDESDEAHKLPPTLNQAMLMLIKHFYDNRDAVVISEGRSIDAKEVPMAVQRLLDLESERFYV